jgi:hypothetical protein
MFMPSKLSLLFRIIRTISVLIPMLVTCEAYEKYIRSPVNVVYLLRRYYFSTEAPDSVLLTHYCVAVHFRVERTSLRARFLAETNVYY